MHKLVISAATLLLASAALGAAPPPSTPDVELVAPSEAAPLQSNRTYQGRIARMDCKDRFIEFADKSCKRWKYYPATSAACRAFNVGDKIKVVGTANTSTKTVTGTGTRQGPTTSMRGKISVKSASGSFIEFARCNTTCRAFLTSNQLSGLRVGQSVKVTGSYDWNHPSGCIVNAVSSVVR